MSGFAFSLQNKASAIMRISRACNGGSEIECDGNNVTHAGLAAETARQAVMQTIFGASEAVLAARFGANPSPRRGKPASALLAQRSQGQNGLLKIHIKNQLLAAKARSHLRVICATPIQKRSDSHRSERFLYCVCRSLR
jgi:hypothetical protein